MTFVDDASLWWTCWITTYITTSHHDCVCFLDNVIKVLETLLIFNLGNNLNVGPIVVGKEFLQIANIISSTDEGCGNELDLNKQKEWAKKEIGTKVETRDPSS